MSDAENEEEQVLDGIITDKDELRELIEALCRKYQDAKSNRSNKELTWAKWRRQAEARPRYTTKNTPIPNASNVVPPLSQIIWQALSGHLKQMFGSINPPWYVKALRKGDKDLLDQCKTLTRYYNILSDSRLDLNMKRFNTEALFDMALMGTVFVQVPWTNERWQFKTESEGVEEQIEASFHDGPELIVTAIEDVVYPENYKDIQKMPWISSDYPIAEYELKNLATDGVFDPEGVEAILANSGTPVLMQKTEEQNSIMNSDPDRTDQIILTKFWFKHDVDKDGKYEDLVFIVHVPTKTVLSQQYNEFGYRMIVSGNFIPRTFALEGRGSGQTCEYSQDEIEGIHNLRNDNMKFANMRMVAVKRNVFRSNEELSPGKIIPMDNPTTDIMPIQLGEVYPSSLQAENQTMNYAREASLMLSTMTGSSDQRLGTRDTFRGQNLRTARGQGLFTAIADGITDFYGEIGMMIFFQLVKNKERVISNERKIKRLTDEEIALLEKALDIKMSDIPFKMAFTIRTTDVDQTFEVKRQSMLTLAQLYAQYAQQTFPLAMQVLGPAGMQLKKIAPEAWNHMLALYVGSTKLMESVFEFFGEEDPDKYVPDVRKYEMLQEMMRSFTDNAIEQQKRAKALQEQMQGNVREATPIGIEEEGIRLDYEGPVVQGQGTAQPQEPGGMM
jgi:hypothetical protein